MGSRSQRKVNEVRPQTLHGKLGPQWAAPVFQDVTLVEGDMLAADVSEASREKLHCCEMKLLTFVLFSTLGRTGGVA